MPSPHDRNIGPGIQFGELRQLIDARFNAVHDALEDSYYGTPQFDGAGKFTGRVENGWKHGQSHPFINGPFVWDLNPITGMIERWNGTAIVVFPSAKGVFNTLHGLIWHLHHLALIAENSRRPFIDRYSAEKIDPFVNEFGVPTNRRVSDDASAAITDLQASGYELVI